MDPNARLRSLAATLSPATAIRPALHKRGEARQTRGKRGVTTSLENILPIHALVEVVSRIVLPV